MRIKKVLFSSVFIYAALALIRRAFARPSSAKRASHSAPYDAIDAYVEAQIRRLNLPGGSLAIVDGDQIVHMCGFGSANAADFGQIHPDGEAPIPQTPFFIGSLTKSFTALAVMQLVEGGKIALDAPVQRYLPWFRVADAQASTRISVRHLLNQTSGLPLLPSWQLLADFDDRLDATERQARAQASIHLNHAPGTKFEYCNLNYNLLGLVIEAASGEPYAEYVQNHIFSPLGMRHSHTSKSVAKQNGLATGHQSWFGVPVPVPDLPVPGGSLPSGQLIASAEDMGRYLIAHLNGGSGGCAGVQVQILSPEGIAELHRPAVDASSFGVSQQYGMGWYIEQQGQTTIVWHTGMVPDFFTYVALLPDQKKGIVLLLNANHFTMQLTMTEVGAGLVALLAGKPPAPIRLGAIPWVQRSLLFIPLLQIAGVFATLRRINRWRNDPALRPTRGRLWGKHILLPLLTNTLVALTLVPMLSKLCGFLMLFMPDFAWLGLVSGSFAFFWSIIRTRLMLTTLGKSSPPNAPVGKLTG